ncbi:uncharacterized protein LOC129570963 isoform X2 [Sitodiplosis mosellana]|uniref:uncharacterized protein LOC129570963 isoform X2 n=1 Tax=Sitodiplosis mosellana TaxID=263140 RepID=UPI002444CB42|nr:uncharacterized protein LOC129570963 isoform X2 [Sitodiplosis mosellana]
MKGIYERRITRSISSVFELNGFSDPMLRATQAANSIFVVEVCPELEVQLSLIQPRKMPKRRRSTSSAGLRQIKRRRYSCAAGFPALIESVEPEAALELQVEQTESQHNQMSDGPDNAINHAELFRQGENEFCDDDGDDVIAGLTYSGSDTDEAEADMSGVTGVTPVLANMHVDNKENEQKQQQITTKRWYDGVVVKPVAFRSTSKQSFYQN